MPKIYIAGAHSRGITTGHYLQYLDPDIEIVAYLYDNDEENPDSVDGVPVLKIDDDSKLDVDNVVYLGVRGVNQEHLTKTLLNCGMKHIVPVDVKLDMELRNKYLKKSYEASNRKYEKIYDYAADEHKTIKAASIYVASSALDKPLKSHYDLIKEENIIQVGATLTEDRIKAAFFDDIGDNISFRNKQFCELTALYWIWKNAKEDIVGLVHYRRHFMLPERWIEIMEDNDIDVILPVPLYVHPNIDTNYRNRHVEANWDNMLSYIKDDKASEFFKKTGLYSPCNMLIAKKEVFDKLCEWLFPILFYVADKGGILEDPYQNRYPGFISERLITYFFENNRDKYRVVYADKNFLE